MQNVNACSSLIAKATRVKRGHSALRFVATSNTSATLTNSVLLYKMTLASLPSETTGTGVSGAVGYFLGLMMSSPRRARCCREEFGDLRTKAPLGLVVIKNGRKFQGKNRSKEGRPPLKAARKRGHLLAGIIHTTRKSRYQEIGKVIRKITTYDQQIFRKCHASRELYREQRSG